MLRNKLLPLCAICATLLACHDDISDSIVPEYNVSFSCNASTINAILQQTKQPNLDTPGGYVRVFDKNTLNASDIVGVGGLLILQSFEGQFYAFDLACPQCFSVGGKNKISRIDVGEDGMSAVCPTCNSVFGAVFWGSPAPTAGLANQEKQILRQYKARRSGDGQTIIVSR